MSFKCVDCKTEFSVTSGNINNKQIRCPLCGGTEISLLIPDGNGLPEPKTEAGVDINVHITYTGRVTDEQLKRDVHDIDDATAKIADRYKEAST